MFVLLFVTMDMEPDEMTQRVYPGNVDDFCQNNVGERPRSAQQRDEEDLEKNLEKN
jgi:hypothetical protein